VGGDLYSTMKLIDTMHMSSIPIRTIGWGKVASAGLFLLMSGDARYLAEHCTILSHNATYSADRYSVRVNDVSRQKEFELIMNLVLDVYLKSTGKDLKYIKKHLLTDNDVYLSSADAIKHGLADYIIPYGVEWLKS
jgi:ATP-dependent protease ClpP protease subunit